MTGRIQAHDLSKRFFRGELEPRTFKELVIRPFRGGRRDSFWALKSVSFEVAPGEVLGVIGRNGSGKSTLLRLVGGIGVPDEGSVRREGRMLSMLDLGLGFHPDLTGEENVYVSGVIHGLTRREIRERMVSIVEFAELDAVMHTPLRTYSSGMRLRLAFAVAAHCDPEILLIDEVLAVGDHAFQNKCLARIEEFQASGCAIMLVSHDVNQVRRIASRVLWLHQGNVRALGRPAPVSDDYLEFMETSGASGETDDITKPSTSDGTLRRGEIEITRVRLLSQRGEPITKMERGQSILVEVHFRFRAKVDSPLFLVAINREDGQKACQLNTDDAGVDTRHLPDPGVLRVAFDRLDLCSGEYFIDVGIFEEDWDFAYDYKWHAVSLSVHSDSGTEGVVDPPARWEFSAKVEQDGDAPPTGTLETASKPAGEL